MRRFFGSRDTILGTLCGSAAAGILFWGGCSQSDSGGSPSGSATTGSTDASSTTSSGAGGAGTTASTSTSTSTGSAGSPAASTGVTTGTTGAGGVGVGATGGQGGAATGGAGAGTGGAGGSGGSGGGASASASVLQYHKNLSRDGLYIDPAFTKVNAAKIHKDTTFTATIQGPTFAQPLYVEGINGKNLVIAVTIQNRVYALDAASGAVVWQKQVGTPAATGGNFYCGDMATIGIVGTPVIDAASKTLFFDAAETGPVRRIHRWDLATGTEQMGWPVDVVANAHAGATTFDPHVQSQRAAPTIVNGTVYFPYGGIIGDCGNYHGWVLGISIANPTMTKAFATQALAGGIWGPGGLASDGTSIFATTGNTTAAAGQFRAPATWGHGEAVLKFSAGPTYGGTNADNFHPSDWASLDNGDTDIGGSGPIVVDVPGATPSRLVVALGKNGVIYLLDPSNLGGQGTGNGTTGEGIASAKVASNAIIQAGAAYTTAMGTYVVFKGNGVGCPGGQSGDLTAVKISATSPPKPTVAWCARQGGNGSPMVTTTDGHAEAVVWSLGSKLMGFDGDTGAAIFNGGGAGDTLSGMSKFITPIAASGRIFVATDSNVYAFTMQ